MQQFWAKTGGDTGKSCVETRIGARVLQKRRAPRMDFGPRMRLPPSMAKPAP